MKVTSVLIFEGLANLAMMLAKGFVGLTTGSAAIISDALHSLTDLVNNAIALIAAHMSEQPEDDDHHYGHHKFEQLAVFSLAVLLLVVAIELVFNAIRRYGQPVEHSQLAMWVMLATLVINVLLTSWEHYWARRLDSKLLEADAQHTLGDVMTTLAAIAGWQFAARGYPWVDTLAAVIVAVMILIIGIGLLRNAIPILVDHSEHSRADMAAAIIAVKKVSSVSRVRVRQTGAITFADVEVQVDPSLPTQAAHDICDQIEKLLLEKFGIDDVVVHIEPDA